MTPEIDVLLERLEALQSEMAEHRQRMRALLQRNDADWVTELEKYYTARQLLLEGDKELAELLRRGANAA